MPPSQPTLILTAQSPLTISGKELGALALPDFCPRCFWLKRRMKALPFRIFPGIFSSIDAYTRNIVDHHLPRHRRSRWFAALGAVEASMAVPSATRFRTTHSETGVTLTGAMDAIFRRADGSFLIADYKTARHTPGQEHLLPLYEVQLNAYAYIAQHAEHPAARFAPISALALIYMEPASTHTVPRAYRHVTSQGFTLEFTAKVVEVGLDTARIPLLLEQARTLHAMSEPPTARAGCGDCGGVETLMALLSPKTVG